MSTFNAGQLAALKEAVASGVRSVSHGGNTVTYSSTDEMLRTIARIERELGLGANRRRVSYPAFSKGV